MGFLIKTASFGFYLLFLAPMRLFLFQSFPECTINQIYGGLAVGLCYCVTVQRTARWSKCVFLCSVFKETAQAGQAHGVEQKSGTNWSALLPLSLHSNAPTAHQCIVLSVSAPSNHIQHPSFNFCSPSSKYLSHTAVMGHVWKLQPFLVFLHFGYHSIFSHYSSYLKFFQPTLNTAYILKKYQTYYVAVWTLYRYQQSDETH